MDIIENGMEQLVITAPIDGTLSILDVELGQQIKPGEKLQLSITFNHIILMFISVSITSIKLSRKDKYRQQ